MVKYLVEAAGLKKEYKRTTVVKDFSLMLRSGEAVGLFGSNGAGKTSVMKLLALVERPDAGKLIINGVGDAKEQHKMRKEIGFAPQEIALFEELTCRDNLNIFSLESKTEKKKKIDVLIDAFSLEEFIDKKVSKLSGGMKRRVNFAVALLNNPILLIADEPFAGIDPQHRHRILAYLKQLKEQGMAQVISSHYVENLNFLCDKIIYMNNGLIEKTERINMEGM